MHILIFMTVVSLFLGGLSLLYLYLNFPACRQGWYLVAHLLLTLNIVYSRFLPEWLPSLLVKASSWLSGLAIAGLYYIILLGLLHGLLALLGRLLGFRLPSITAALGLLCVCFFVAFGTYRAFHPVLRTELITTSKLPANTTYRIAFITDVHLGRILGHSYAEGLVQRVNELKPDLVLISGDLLDEKIHYVNEESSLEPFKALTAPAFLGLGNHDYLDQPPLWWQMVEAHGITVLNNRSVIFKNQLKLTGIADFSRDKGTATLDSLKEGNSSYYSILLDHQPRRMEAASKTGYDLYLAGHTHTGQLFPNRLITQKMYQLDYGRKNFGSLTAITNNGYGFWGPPVRTEEAPELVLIELRGK